MLTLLLIIGIAVLGLGALSIIGTLISGLFWLIFLPIRLAFRIVFGALGMVFGLIGLIFGGVFGLLGGVFGLVFGLIGALFGLLFSPMGFIVGALALVFGLVTHMMPVAILGMVGWALYKAFFAARVVA